MNTLLRTLTLWLVLLAVPFQGYAAAAMPGCATGHASPSTVSASMSASMSAAASVHHGMHGAHGAMHAHGAGTDQHPTPQDAGHHGNAKCGACAACSIGAAMAPSPLFALAVHAPPALTVPFAAGHLPTVDLDLPERPPRFFLA